MEIVGRYGIIKKNISPVEMTIVVEHNENYKTKKKRRQLNEGVITIITNAFDLRGH